MFRLAAITVPALSLLLQAGCTTAKKAVPYASLRSGCDEDNIEVVRQNGHDAVLNVCGTHEDWRWHPVNGFEYVGLSAEQPARPPADSDNDGVMDNVDACPTVAGMANPNPAANGCPPPVDSDADGIPDSADACPTVKGITHTDVKQNGCPPDQDGDGVDDAADACPDVAGVATPDDAKTNGCPPPPPDQDGDGVVDAEDACPDVVGVQSTDAKLNGCPEPPVRIDGDKLILKDRIEFEAGKTGIAEASEPVLDELAKFLEAHPELLQVEIGGFTDNEGDKAAKINLSRMRAQKVVQALIKRGIKQQRLKFKGYGPESPVADNATPEGRAQNERIEVKILKREEPPAEPAPEVPEP